MGQPHPWANLDDTWYAALESSDDSVLGSRTEAYSKLSGAAITWATELRALETARTRVEAEYLEGSPTLYPATLRRWTEQRELSDGLVDLIRRLAELDDLDPLPRGDPDVFDVRVRQLVADHVEMGQDEGGRRDGRRPGSGPDRDPLARPDGSFTPRVQGRRWR